ncbi:MAG: hypothetical protein N3F67_02170 [Acidilobaceae archaeon]|nr:hypothetical protein [Acidilobaceae archaeon]
MSFEELLREIGGEPEELRRVVADMVRAGEIVKVASQERKKVLYSLRSLPP